MPTGRFRQVNDVDFLQIIEVRARPNGNAIRRVAFVQFVIGVDVDLVDRRFPLELNVDQMW